MGNSLLAISLIAVLLIGTVSLSDAYAEKLKVCHDDKTKKIKDKDLQKHLDHGDTEGACPTSTGLLEMIEELWAAIMGLDMRVMELEENGVGEKGDTGEKGETGSGGGDTSALEARIAALEEKFRCDDLAGTDLSGQDLSGRDFSGCDLRGTDFTGADLSDTDLTGADLGSPIDGIETNAILLNADLTGATLGSFYIDTTFSSEIIYHAEYGIENSCDDVLNDNAIAILEEDGDWAGGSLPRVFPQTPAYFEGPSYSGATVFTILCETAE